MKSTLTDLSTKWSYTALGLFCLLSGSLLSSCGRAVVFGTLAHQSQSSASAPLSLFLDRDGSLYPPDGPAVDEAELAHRGYGKGYLLNYYVRNPGDLTQVYNLHGIPTPSTNIASGWPSLQAKIRNDVARTINSRLEALGPHSKLVVLIHGFNNTKDEAKNSYNAVEARMNQLNLPNGPYQILEVYWDGRRGAFPAFFVLAQSNAQFVGLGLRGVLNQVSHAHPIRILNHSTGALLSANILWNVTTSMGNNIDSVDATKSSLVFWQNLTTLSATGQTVPQFFYQKACRNLTYYRTPTHPDIRMGCIAAASPGDTYTDYLDRTPALSTNAGGYRRVIISINPTDMVLNKFWAGALFSKKLGITNLGRRSSIYTRFVADAVNIRSTGGQSYQVPFYCPQEKHKFNHSLIGYTNSNQMLPFLELLLGEGPVTYLPPCSR